MPFHPTHGSLLMDKIQILIAGIPTSGKSTFGKWLAEKQAQALQHAGDCKASVGS